MSWVGFNGVGGVVVTRTVDLVNVAKTIAGSSRYEATINLSGGDDFEFSVWARHVSGDAAVLYVDSPLGTSLAKQAVSGHDEWRNYVVKGSVPYTAETSDVIFGVGVAYASIGEAEFRNAKIKVNGGPLSVMAKGDAGTGRYIRYADGTQICTWTVNVTDITTAWGSVFTSGLVARSSPPAAFLVGTTPTYSYSSKGDPAGSAWVYSNDTQVGLVRGTADTGTYTIDITAIGVWSE